MPMGKWPDSTCAPRRRRKPVAEANSVQPPRRCRDDSERRSLIDRAHALGVPRDYGRSRGLRIQREPSHLVPIGPDIHDRMQWLLPRAARALARMREAAARSGVTLQIVSGFRSIEYQLGIVERKLTRGLTMDEILRVSAAPGYSEHHTGRCVDITAPGSKPLEEEFERTSAFAWLQRHAAKHRFALSYPRGNRHGIAYEPWHWCWHARSPRH